MSDRSIEHLCPLHFRFKKGNDRSHPVSEYLPDLFHMFVLHLDAVTDELGGISSHLVLLDDSIDDHPAYGNSKLMKPIDEAGDDSNRKAFRKRDKKESGEGFIGQEVFRMSHPILEI